MIENARRTCEPNGDRFSTDGLVVAFHIILNSPECLCWCEWQNIIFWGHAIHAHSRIITCTLYKHSSLVPIYTPPQAHTRPHIQVYITHTLNTGHIRIMRPIVSYDLTAFSAFSQFSTTHSRTRGVHSYSLSDTRK